MGVRFVEATQHKLMNAAKPEAREVQPAARRFFGAAIKLCSSWNMAFAIELQVTLPISSDHSNLQASHIGRQDHPFAASRNG